MKQKRAPKELDLESLDAVSGGWSVGGYVSGTASGFGVSKTLTIDTSGNVYVSTGTGSTVVPGLGVSAGGFYSTGTPADHFAGDGLSTNVSAGHVAGVEVGTSSSGQNIGISVGTPGSPLTHQETTTNQIDTSGTPDPTAYDAMGNYTGVGTGSTDHATDTPTMNPNDLHTPDNLPDTTPHDLYGETPNHDGDPTNAGSYTDGNDPYAGDASHTDPNAGGPTDAHTDPNTGGFTDAGHNDPNAGGYTDGNNPYAGDAGHTDPNAGGYTDGNNPYAGDAGHTDLNAGGYTDGNNPYGGDAGHTDLNAGGYTDGNNPYGGDAGYSDPNAGGYADPYGGGYDASGGGYDYGGGGGDW